MYGTPKTVDNLEPGPQVAAITSIGSVVSPFGSGSSSSGYPQEGTSFYNRLGRRIRMETLRIYGNVLPSNVNAGAVAAQTARILIGYDRQSNGALPGIADVLTSYDTNGGTSAVSYAYQSRNQNNEDRFWIFHDQTMYLPPLGVGGATPAAQQGIVPEPMESCLTLDETFDLDGLEMHFKASTANGPITDVATGALFVIAVGQDTGNAWQFNFAARLEFLD